MGVPNERDKNEGSIVQDQFETRNKSAVGLLMSYQSKNDLEGRNFSASHKSQSIG